LNDLFSKSTDFSPKSHSYLNLHSYHLSPNVSNLFALRGVFVFPLLAFSCPYKKRLPGHHHRHPPLVSTSLAVHIVFEMEADLYGYRSSALEVPVMVVSRFSIQIRSG
jgi:hypothetical protein